MADLPHRDRPILIAGFGSIGRRHFRNLKTLGYERFLFLRSGRSTIESEEIVSYRASANLAELLDERPFAVVVANPTSLHLETARTAAEAGCHLLLEKPIAHQLDGCDQLLETCKRRRIISLVGCQFRFHPLLQTLRSFLHEGRLGAVIGARAEAGDYLPGWHPWEDHRGGYAARGDLGGGVILTWVHPLDYLFHLFGPAEVAGAATRSIPSLHTSCEDWAEMTLQFTSGVIGQVHVDYLQRPPVHQLTVWGDGGRAVLDFMEGTLTIVDVDGRREVHSAPPGFDRNDMFLAETRHWLECIRDGVQTQIPVEDGLAVLKLALEAKRLAA